MAVGSAQCWYYATPRPRLSAPGEVIGAGDITLLERAAAMAIDDGLHGQDVVPEQIVTVAKILWTEVTDFGFGS